MRQEVTIFAIVDMKWCRTLEVDSGPSWGLTPSLCVSPDVQDMSYSPCPEQPEGSCGIIFQSCRHLKSCRSLSPAFREGRYYFTVIFLRAEKFLKLLEFPFYHSVKESCLRSK